MKTVLEQLEAVERLRSILTIRQFGAFVGLDVAPAADDKFSRYLGLTPDQLEAEFGSSAGFRAFIRDQLAAQRDASARQLLAPVPESAALDDDELEPFAADDDDNDTDGELAIEARLAEVRAAVADALVAECEAAALDDEAVFDGLTVMPLRPFAQ